MALNSNVALNPNPKTSPSLSALLAASSKYGEVPLPEGNPAEVAAAQAQERFPASAVPQLAEDYRGVPVQERSPLTAESTDAERAAVLGIPRAGASYQPVLDINGEVMRNPDTGEVITQPVSGQEFADEQAAQLGSLPNQQIGLEYTVEDPALGKEPDHYSAVKAMTTSANEAAQGRSGARRLTGYLSPSLTEDRMSQWADKSAGSLAVIQRNMGKDLFVPAQTSLLTTDKQYPAGTAIMIEEGLFDDEASMQANMDKVSTIMGLSKVMAVNQTQQFREDSVGAQVQETGNPLVDGKYMPDMIDSLAHAAGTAFERSGVKMSREGIRKLANAAVQAAVNRGEFIVDYDRNNPSRVILAATPDTKKQARNLKYVSEALAGENQRTLASLTPNDGGTNFIAGREGLTAKSIRDGGKTTAALATKSIMGSVATVYLKKDVAYKQMEFDAVVGDMEPEGRWSNHWLAHRIGASENDYNALRNRVEPSETYDATDPAQVQAWERAKDIHAKEGVQLALKGIEFDLKNANLLGRSLRYTTFTHSLVNQRFFPNSAGTDFMSSKSGVRDMQNFGIRDAVKPVDLFDEKRVATIKEKAMRIFRMPGKEQQKALEALSESERSAMGTMLNATINYYTSVSPEPDNGILRLPPAKIIEKYTTGIGNALANVGKEYNDFLADPANATAGIQGLLAAMPKGEALSNKNLWDDMFQMKIVAEDPVAKNVHKELTHVSFDDGNQNGIFLQALFFGNSDNAIRLGAASPGQGDIRAYAMGVLTEKIDEMLEDFPEKQAAWQEFFKTTKNKFGDLDALAKEFFKKPLMQNSYGKDAGMFGEHVLDFMENTKLGDALGNLATGGGFKSTVEASEFLNNSLEATLREVVASKDTDILKHVGRYTAILNTVVRFSGIAGDEQVFASAGTLPMSKSTAAGEGVVFQGKDGVMTKRRSRVTIDGYNQVTDEITQIEQVEKAYDPAATKGLQKFFNRRTGKFDYFNNALGSAQARLMVVMPIQAADGDLVKLATLAVNSKRKLPVPVIWIHDSFGSTAGGSLLYRNAYNNVAIPQAVPGIMEFGPKIAKAVKEAEEKEFARVRKMEAVGIGELGDYPALGAMFDEEWQKIQEGDPYKQVFLERKHNDLSKWKAFVDRTKELLHAAEAQGWRPPGSMVEGRRMELAVTPDQFTKLANLSKEILRLSGARGQLDKWAREWPGKVQKTFQDLRGNPHVRNHGIFQMTYSGGGGRKDVKPKERVADLQEQDSFPDLINKPDTSKSPRKNYVPKLGFDDPSSPDYVPF